MTDQVTDSVELPTNTEYSAGIDDWILFRDVYESKPDTMRDPVYLIRHEIEQKKDGSKKWLTRQSRTFPLNFVEPIVSIWQDLFMKGEPTVPSAVEDLFNGFADDVDGNGNTLITYLETEMLRDRFVYGAPTTLVDAPINVSLNAEEERELGIRPFLTPVNRISLVDWSVEKGAGKRSGRYNWVTFQYQAHKPRFSHEQKDELQWYRRTIYRRRDTEPTVWSQIYAGKGPNEKHWTRLGSPQLIEGFTEIPVVTMRNTDSWIRDVAQQVLKYLNLESTLDNILYYQGYRHTFLSGNIPAKERGTINEYTMVITPEGTTVTSIPAENPQALIERLAQTENNIWRFGLQQIRQVPTNSKAVQSADTQREEKEPTLNMVKRNIRQFEVFCNQIVKVCAEYNNLKDFKEEVRFSRDITDSDINTTVTVMNAVKSELSRLPTLRKGILKQLAQSLNFPQDVTQQVEKEIDGLQEQDLADDRIGSTLRQVFGDNSRKALAAPQSGEDESPVSTIAGATVQAAA